MQNDPINGYRQPSRQDINIPPRSQEGQLQIRRFYNNKDSQDWMRPNFDPTNNNQQGSSSAANLDYLQKEFLRQEYSKQQDELNRKKEAIQRQKENDLTVQMELKTQIEYENTQQKQHAIDKKRALGELYRIQIEKDNIEKQKKKQSSIEEDKYRLQMQAQIDNQYGQRARIQREAQVKNISNPNSANLYQNNQTNSTNQQRLDLGKGESLMNQIGRGDDKRRQYFDRFEMVQAVNNRNFVSYDELKSKKSEAFANYGRKALLPNDNQQARVSQGKQGFQGDDEKRVYNEALKRQMVENQYQRGLEKQDRQRPYDQPSYPPQSQQQQYKKPQQLEQARIPSSQQQEYQILPQQNNSIGQPKSGENGGYSDGQTFSSTIQKQEDQLRYRSMLDVQQEQQRLLKDVERDDVPRNNSQVAAREYDVMGNQKIGQNMNSQVRQSMKGLKNIDETQKYREFLQQQQQQQQQNKRGQEFEVADLERRFNDQARVADINDNNQREPPSTDEQAGYNPTNNPASANLQQQQQQQRGSQNEIRGGNGNQNGQKQQRIDYSEFASKNILRQNNIF